ncbi:MAG: Gldg family protein [Clostridia bacterium]|nr:Gldg family protein [Clostridia bacterium]
MNNFNMNKKLRYGTVSVAFTALFIAALIAFNVVFSALASKFLWYIDMTSETLYTLSDKCVELLDDIEAPVKILFCDDPDNLEATDTTRLVYNTALQLEEKLDNIEVETVNVIENRSAVNKYLTTATTEIKTTDVIIESGTEFRKLALTAFYTFSNTNSTEPWAYNAESRFASTIIAVTRAEAPVCAVLSNHGEAYRDQELLSLVSDAGYELVVIDLSKDEIPEDCRLMISYNPTSDFMSSYDGVSEVSEIEKLDKFLDGLNSFMIFVSPQTPVLPNLEEYLYEWGVTFGRYTDEVNNTYNEIVKDTSQSLTFDGYTVVSEYVTDENSLGAQVNKDLTNAGTAPKVVFRDAMPIIHSDNYSSTGYYSSNGYSRQINDIFVTSENAVIEANGKVVAKAGEADRFPMMTITTEGRQIGGSNTTDYSYVMACGSIEFASSAMLQSNVYGNRDSLYSAMRIMQKEIVVIDLAKKPFAEVNIESLTSSDATSYTLMLAIIPAAIVFICGTAVMVRRRVTR